MFVAEIGDVHRFADPSHLCSWAGLTPQHRESDTVVRRGHITKQGSKLVRWAAVEAIQRQPAGKNIAKVAAARKLLTLVYYGLRDGAHPGPDPPAGGGMSISSATRARSGNCLAPKMRRGRGFD